MNTTLTRPNKAVVNVAELTRLHAALREQQQGAGRLLAQIEKVLRGVKAAAGARPATTGVGPARSSPLDAVKLVATATADLREGNGNLSAVRVAKLFGVSVSQLAGWLGRSKQAVSKTPDADSLQAALGYFERVARLRLALRNEREFRQWLRTPHELLEHATPLELLAKGEWQAMADYVDDLLTGAPT